MGNRARNSSPDSGIEAGPMLGLLLSIEHAPRSATLAICVALAGLAGWGDYVTGADAAFTLAYLLPVSLAAWCCGIRAGIGIAGLAAGLWFAVNTLSGTFIARP